MTALPFPAGTVRAVAPAHTTFADRWPWVALLRVDMDDARGYAIVFATNPDVAPPAEVATAGPLVADLGAACRMFNDLAAPIDNASVCYPDPDRCENPAHDHFGQRAADENGGIEPGDDRLVCADCRRPMHYDRIVDDYRHDDPDAPACFLIRTAVIR